MKPMSSPDKNILIDEDDQDIYEEVDHLPNNSLNDQDIYEEVDHLPNNSLNDQDIYEEVDELPNNNDQDIYEEVDELPNNSFNNEASEIYEDVAVIEGAKPMQNIPPQNRFGIATKIAPKPAVYVKKDQASLTPSEYLTKKNLLSQPPLRPPKIVPAQKFNGGVTRTPGKLEPNVKFAQKSNQFAHKKFGQQNVNDEQ